MNEDDLVLRNLTYTRFVELRRAPTAAEMAGAARRERAEVVAAWERLHAEHALVLDLATGGIKMAWSPPPGGGTTSSSLEAR